MARKTEPTPTLATTTSSLGHEGQPTVPVPVTGMNATRPRRARERIFLKLAETLKS